MKRQIAIALIIALQTTLVSGYELGVSEGDSRIYKEEIVFNGQLQGSRIVEVRILDISYNSALIGLTNSTYPSDKITIEFDPMNVTNATGKRYSPKIGNLSCPEYSRFIYPIDALQANCQVYAALNIRNIFKELFQGQITNRDVNPNNPTRRLEVQTQVTLDLVYEAYLAGYYEKRELAEEVRNQLSQFPINIQLKSYLQFQGDIVTGWLFTLNMTTSEIDEIYSIKWDQPSIHPGAILINSTGGVIFDPKTGWVIETYIEDQIPFAIYHRKITYNQLNHEPELFSLADNPINKLKEPVIIGTITLIILSAINFWKRRKRRPERELYPQEKLE